MSASIISMSLLLIGCSTKTSSASPPLHSTENTTAVNQQHASVKRSESAVPVPSQGWNYVRGKLKLRGIAQADIDTIFDDPRMPPPFDITFRLKPVESSDIYKQFRTLSQVELGRVFLERRGEALQAMEERYGVSAEVVTAILLVETHFGENLGEHLVLNRLARVCSVGDPEILAHNVRRHQAENPAARLKDSAARAEYLEDTFFPELEALFRIGKEQGVDLFSLKGSIAGAFGIPQFLPRSLERFGVDGDGDGTISLFNMTDAIFSTGKFLGAYGWNDARSESQRRDVIWNYNHSSAYIDTVLWLAASIGRRPLGTEGHGPNDSRR
jgi:membrane-bound lytic murein transglycosylase B